jgi:hypothetical protein
MIIPGILISVLTFPGVIVHEAAHQLFCRLFRIPVYKVKYFRFGNPAGYVLHERTDNPKANFFICIGPFLINTLLGAAVAFPSAIKFWGLGGGNLAALSPLDLLNLWLGISILMHAFPSTGDAKSLYASVIRNPNVNILAKALVLPVVGLIYLGAFGSIVWLDLGYAIGMSYLLPKLMVGLLI